MMIILPVKFKCLSLNTYDGETRKTLSEHPLQMTLESQF